MDSDKLFKDLNDELAKNDMTLELICVGGFALEYYDLRGTKDIDAFYQENSDLMKIIEKIGKDNQIDMTEERWLNNSVSNLNRRPPKKVCRQILGYSNLSVMIPSLEYILGMKFESARNRDIDDASLIIKTKDLRDVAQLFKTLRDFGFQPDLSLILEAFEIAYGVEWLSNYLEEHLEEIKSLS